MQVNPSVLDQNIDRGMDAAKFTFLAALTFTCVVTKFGTQKAEVPTPGTVLILAILCYEFGEELIRKLGREFKETWKGQIIGSVMGISLASGVFHVTTFAVKSIFLKSAHIIFNFRLY